MGPPHQKDPRTGRDRRGDGAGRARGGAGGAPGAVRNGGVSESVAKASRGGICGQQKRGISTIRLRRFGAIRVFATDLDNLRRRGPLHGRRPRRSLRSWTGPAPTPGCRDVHFALERCILPSRGAVRSARSSAKCTSREQNAPLDEHRTDPPPTPPDGPIPHRPAPTPVPDHDPRREGPSGLTAALFCLDHLRALGPLMFRWTTCVRLDHLVHEIRWSNGTQVVPTAFKWSKQTEGVTTCETPSHHAGRTVGAKRGRGGRTAPTPRPADPDVARVAPG